MPNATANGHANGHYPVPNGYATIASNPSIFMIPLTIFFTLYSKIIYILRFMWASPLHHSHVGVCPITGVKGERHDFKKPSATDDRSVCPALNTMANHGYLPRNGKNLTALQVSFGLKACYGLSTGLALFLSFGGFFLIHKSPFPWKLKLLSAIGIHFDSKWGVEHNASLVHEDVAPLPEDAWPETPRYAPIEVKDELVEQLMNDVEPHPYAYYYLGKQSSHEDHKLMDEKDVARARIRREKLSPPLDPIHAEIARGEMGIILGVWETVEEKCGKKGVPLRWMRDWMKENRMPEGWRPSHVQELGNVVARAFTIRKTMEKMRGPVKWPLADRLVAWKIGYRK